MSDWYDFSAAAVAAVLNTAWLAAAVAGSAWLPMRRFRGMNAATRHILWWGVLAVIAVLPLIPSRAAKSQQAVVTLAEAPLPEALPVAAEPAAPVALPRHNWPVLAMGAWLVAFLLQSGRVGWSYAHVRALKRRARHPDPDLRRRSFEAWRMSCGIRRPVRLLISDEIASPVAVGFRDPVVILPESLPGSLTEAELDHVLLHELAHVARRDDWTNLAARVAGAFLGLHPVAAWVLRQIAREREAACDDWVVAMTGEARPYAASLARLFELCRHRRGVLLASAMAERGSNLGNRIAMLLARGRHFAPHASLSRVAAGAVVLTVFIAAGARAPRLVAWAQDTVPPASPVPAPVPTLPARPANTRKPSAAPAAPLRPGASVPLPPPPAQPAVTPQLSPPPPPPAQPQIPSQPQSFLAALVAAGYGGLSVDEIIELKNSGISAGFLNSLHGAGWPQLSTRDLIDLRTHGVRIDDFRQIHALGFGPYSARQAIEFTASGVRPELFRALKECGFAKAEPREIIEAQTHGLRAEHLRAAREYGTTLTLKQILRLKQAGVL